MEIATTTAGGNPQDLARIARSLRHSAQAPISTMQEAQSILAKCETLRRPAKRDWIAGRVATLLSHFYVSLMGEAEMRAVASDWLDALAEFPEWAIGEACSEWLRTQDRKPTIAGIRKLCAQHFAVVEYTRQKAMRGPQATEERAPISPEERAARAATIAETVERLARKAGGRDA